MGATVKGQAIVLGLALLSVALAGCAGNDVDTDGDGWPDRLEERGWESIIYTMTESQVITFRSDPTKVDTDGDGLSDWDETFVRGATARPLLNPSDPDTDGDGLSDCQEWYEQVGDCPQLPGFPVYDFKQYVTDPVFMDSDFPSHSRYLEYHINDGRGFQDHEGYWLTGSPGNEVYTRGDGISDYDEIFGYDIVGPEGTVRQGVTSSPQLLDSDDDLLEDGEEALLFGSDPNDEDTDGDGCIDGNDLFPSRVDTYTVEVDSFMLIEGTQVDGSARLVALTNIMENLRFLPASGSRQVEQGDTVMLTDLTGPAKARTDCVDGERPQHLIATPIQPWILVQAITVDKDVVANQDNQDMWANFQFEGLDSGSLTTPEGHGYVNGVFWNPIEDVFRWSIPQPAAAWRLQDDSEAFTVGEDGFLHLQGEQGEVWFRPIVLLE